MIRTGLPVLRITFSAQTRAIGVFPRPQSAQIAARPLRIPHSTRRAWKSNRNSGIQTGLNPWEAPPWDFRSRNFAYAVFMPSRFRLEDSQPLLTLRQSAEVYALLTQKPLDEIEKRLGPGIACLYSGSPERDGML